MFTGIRAKVVLPIVGGAALFLIVLSYGIYQQSAHELKSSLDTNMRYQGDYISFLLRCNYPPHEMYRLSHDIISHPDLPQVKLIRIFSRKGETLYQTGSSELDKVDGSASFNEALHSNSISFRNSSLAQKDLREMSMPVEVDHKLKYVVQVIVPNDGMQLSILKLKHKIIFLCSVILLVVAVGGWVITGGALKPVSMMAKIAKTIGLNHAEERLPVPQSKDEIEELACTFNEMIERLDGSAKQIRRFTADASHELRTPLTIMKGEIEVALRKERTSGELEKTMNSVLDEVNHMSEIVEDMLSLARVDSGEYIIEKESLNLDDLVSRVVRHYRKIASASDCSIVLSLSPGATVVGDAELIGRLVRNLLDNAIKYSERGGKVLVTVGETEGLKYISVQDYGIGIGEDELSRIFERFYRGTNSGMLRKRGTGLGLSICDWIASAHNARITVESNAGKGSLFTVWFPMPES